MKEMDSRTETATRSAWIEVDGLWTQYLQAGDAGSPVLLLHGGGLDYAALSWRYAIGSIARRHRVFALDWPGFGRSDSPRVPWSIQDYITFLGHYMERLGLDRASLVGISLGGAIAIGFALRSPERVDKLVLVDSYGLGGEVPGGWATYLAAYLFVRLPLVTELMWTVLGRSRRLTRKTLESISGDPRAITAELVDEAREGFGRPGVGKAWSAIQRSEILPGGVRTNYLNELGEITAPTLLVHGADDPFVKVALAERAHARIPHSQLAIIPRSGHWPPREKPDEFNQIVTQFLANP
jgi:pimeloyl-ACP methyl ester carboxylesterase